MKIMSAEKWIFYVLVPYAHSYREESGCENEEESKQHKFKRNDNLNSIKLTHQLQAHWEKEKSSFGLSLCCSFRECLFA